MLSAGERRTLNKRVRGAKTAHRDRLRAQIVLAAARGHPNAQIAAGLGSSAGTVRKWRGRFAARGLDGLADRPRAGRPRRISAADRAAVVALACQLPAATGVPLAPDRPGTGRRADRPGTGQLPGLRVFGAADPG
jgi:FixJ family two-component response regulator